MTSEDWTVLESAVITLEHPSFTSNIAGMVGMPVEKLLGTLPLKWSNAVNKAVSAALKQALDAAVYSLPSNGKSLENLHTVACGISGGIGGFFGLAALPVELPISTTIMLRSIAAIAAREGEDTSHTLGRLECLTVFALGDTRQRDQNTGYWLRVPYWHGQLQKRQSS